MLAYVDVDHSCGSNGAIARMRHADLVAMKDEAAQKEWEEVKGRRQEAREKEKSAPTAHC